MTATCPTCLGPVIRRAARAGFMVKTGEYRPSIRSHLSPKPVWRSLLHNPTPEGTAA